MRKLLSEKQMRCCRLLTRTKDNEDTVKNVPTVYNEQVQMGDNVHNDGKTET